MNNFKSADNLTSEYIDVRGRMGEPALRILYNDDQLVAVDKPAGLLVHKSNIDKHETRFLLQQLRDQLGCFVYPIHRLDKPTSGVIVFAKQPEIAALIQAQMEVNTATKHYLLVCRGYLKGEGLIDHALKPINDFKHKNKQALDKPAQEAKTAYQSLATYELDACIDRYPKSRFSLIKASLLTGRKHQIRRHFKHLSHPIIGCPRYGKSNYNHYFANVLGAPRLLLHAWQLTLEHPISKASLSITAPLSGDFLNLVQRFQWDDVLRK